MRPKWIDDRSSVKWWVILAAGAALVLAAPAGLLAAAGPFGAEPSTREFMLVVNPELNADQLKQVLADAGFGEPEAIRGLPPRFRNYCLLTVPAADEPTRERLLAVQGIQAVRPVYRNPNFDYPFLSNGQVITRFKPGVTLEQVRAIAAENGCTIARQIAGLPQVYVFDVDERQQNAYTVAVRIASSSDVVYSNPSMLLKLNRHAVGSIEDPLYPWQWHLHNTGQLPGGLAGADINVETAWDITMGAGAIVAVIDECIQKDHEDLADNYITGYDFFDQDSDPSPFYGPSDWTGDPTGEAHGTAVSGLICAAANNIGVRGVAPEAGLIGCKVSLQLGFVLDQDVADAFLFAEANGAMAVNNSWGWYNPLGRYNAPKLPTIPGTFLFPDVISTAIEQIATQGRGGLGVLVLFSAGNQHVLIPFDNVYATLPTVMAIGATLRDDTLTCYSSYGPQQSVVAPGGGIIAPRDYAFVIEGGTCLDQDMATTDNMEVPGFQLIGKLFGLPYPGWPIRGYNPPMKFLSVPDPSFCPPGDPYAFLGCVPLVPNTYAPPDFPNPNYTRRFNGTSSACPVATGVAALVFSVNPTLTAEQVRNILEHTADTPTSLDRPLHVNEEFDAVTGHNDRYGHGRVNAAKAVQAAAAGKNWPSPVKDIQNVSSQNLVRLFWTNPPNDVDTVLVVRGSKGQLDWAPPDGTNYIVGQRVARDVIVVSNSLTTTIDDTLDAQTGLSGQYEYGIFVRNPASYYSWGRRTSFASAGVTNLLASLSASLTTGRAPFPVHFAGGAIDPSGVKNLAFFWDFGDGATGSGATVDHTYINAGNYIAKLTVTNNTTGQSGEASTRITVLSEFNIPPQATISAAPTTGSAPLVVTFSAIASDADGLVVRYFWDFGDGQTAGERQVEHIYVNAGTYGVKLTATDNLGAIATDAVLITVTTTSTTAARTEPENALDLSACGGGAPLAVVGAALGLLGLVTLRRRSY